MFQSTIRVGLKCMCMVIAGSAIGATDSLTHPLFDTRETINISGTAFVSNHGDFNGDGRVDLIVGNISTIKINVLFQQLDGTFGDLTVLDNNLFNPAGIGVADFDKDGFDDYAVNTDGGVGVAFGKSDMTFTAMSIFATTTITAQDIETADLDGDGNLDIIRSDSRSSGQGRVSVLYGDGTGSFASVLTLLTDDNSSRQLAIADFTGDGRGDIVAANDDFPLNYTLFKSTADRTVYVKDSYNAPANGGYAGAVAGDFDNDTFEDLAFSDVGPSGSQIDVFLGNGDGTFAGPDTYGEDAVGTPRQIVTGDFNGDGILDLATASGFGKEITLHLGDGDGTFTRTTDLFALANGSTSIDAVDLNGDGRDDLVVAPASGSALEIYYSVPEPSSMAMVALLSGVVLRRRR